MTFLGDEGRDVLVVKRMLVDHKFTLLGPTASVGGFFLGPIYYYFMLPFLWVFRLDPVGPAIMVALFGIATVLLIYKVGQDFFDQKTGLVAALLYALSPLVIAYSRSSWNPNLMPFFSLLIIWLTWKTIIENKPMFLILVGFFFGIAIQLHYLVTFLMVIVGVYLFFFYRKKLTTYYLLLTTSFLLGWLPFLLFELRHSFPNLRTLYQFIFFGKETGLVTQRFISIMTDVTFRLFNRLVTNNYEMLANILLIASLSLFIFLWLRNRRDEKLFKTYSLIGLWLVLGICLFGFYQKPIYDYYFGFMFSLPFLLVGLTFSYLFSLKSLPIKVAAVCLLGTILWVNWQGRPFRFTPNRQLDQTKTISRFVLDKTEGNSFNFALITGQNSDHAYRYFFEIWGNKPVTIENLQVDPQRKTVTDQLLVICEVSDCKPLGHSLWKIAGFGRAEIEGEWPVSVVKVFKLGHFREP
ncbi:glycosyltransferase family 39 protein [Candidatus Gottesmanbacteria bacterium]|nr:glycosyltransferase family 39 protein [Candidatus Gottesmanbacteria bacterium]